MQKNPPLWPFHQGIAGLALAVLLPWLALLLPVHQINHDVAWLYYAARGIIHGGELYRDYINPNPPIAWLSLLPAVEIARAMRVTPDLAVEIETLALVSAAMALCWGVARRMDLGVRLTVLIIAALAVALVLLPGAGFAQREHLITILLTPYMAGCAAACGRTRLAWPLAVAIGVMAAAATGIKPYFVLVPAALEAVVLLRAGWRFAIRPQPLAFAAGVLLWIGLTLGFAPAYFGVVVPWALALYGAYRLPLQFAGLLVYGFYIAGALWFCWRPGPVQQQNDIRLCLSAAIAGALAAFVIEERGYIYYMLPCATFLLMANVGAVAATRLRHHAANIDRARWALSRILAIGFVLNIATNPAASVDLPKYAAIAQNIAAQPGPFLILSTRVDPAFPLAVKLNRVWAWRMDCLVPLPGLLAAETQGQPSPYEPMFRAWLAEDLRRFRPPTVFVAPPGDLALPAGFDILPWLLRDPAFAKIWLQYKPDGERDGYRLFRLINDRAAPD